MYDILMIMASGHLRFHELSSSIKYSQPIKIVLMTQNKQKTPFTLKINLLEAYENRMPPPGASTNAPVGHAVVKLRIENLIQDNIVANITKLDICQPDNNKVIISQPVKPFKLGGLQIIEPGFHLTNSEGFRGLKEVKAVVTYQVNGKSYTAESLIFKVIINP